MKNIHILHSFFFFLFIIVFFSCKEKLDPAIPTTIGVKNPGPNNVKAFGSIFGREVTSKGFCYDTLTEPGLDKNVIDLGDGSKSFSCEITGLKPATVYYLRAFAINASGTEFGATVSFTTITPPQVTTGTPVVSNFSTAVLGVYATSSTTMTLLDAGFCYGTNHNPDFNSFKKSGGTTLNYFAAITTLTENTQYYVRAYATYSFGTVFGQELGFKTPSAPVAYSVSGTVTDNEGNTYNTVTIGNQTWMTENLKVTKYNTNVNIPLVAGGFGTWSNTSFGARANYADNTGYTPAYGYMYNFRALLDPQGIAPAGWHIPSEAEWQVLIDAFGGDNSAMAHFMATGSAWIGSGCTPTNFSAMSLLPCGYRSSGGGDSEMGQSVYFWTADYSGSYATAKRFNKSQCAISSQILNLNYGCYIRCIKD